MTLRVDSFTAVATPVSTEGAVGTTGPGTAGVPLAQPANAQGLVIRGMATVTLGTGATGASIRVRQGSSIAGTQVGTDFNVQGTAGNTIAIPFSIPDTSAFALNNAGALYTIGVIQTGAPSGAGTVVRCSVEIDPVIL